MKRYKNIGTFVNKNRRKYFTNAIYPNIPESADDFYVIATDGDRYDKLAQQFYQNSSLWWIIASSNNEERASLYPTPGAQLRIPNNIAKYLQEFDRLNTSR